MIDVGDGGDFDDDGGDGDDHDQVMVVMVMVVRMNPINILCIQELLLQAGSGELLLPLTANVVTQSFALSGDKGQKG